MNLDIPLLCVRPKRCACVRSAVREIHNVHAVTLRIIEMPSEMQFMDTIFIAIIVLVIHSCLAIVDATPTWSVSRNTSIPRDLRLQLLLLGRLLPAPSDGRVDLIEVHRDC